MRAAPRATLSWRSRVSKPKSVTRSPARATPISPRCGFRGGAASLRANGPKKRPAIRSRLRFARRSTRTRLPCAWLEAMLDARLQEIAPQDDFNLAAFRAFAGESEGARLRLAARIAAGGEDLDQADAHAPAAMALALTRVLGQLPFKAGAAPTLIPADVAARHGASAREFDARRASPGVVAACAELQRLGARRARGSGAPAESFALRRSCRPSFRLGPCASISTGSTATRAARSTPPAKSRRSGGNGRSGVGRERGEGSADVLDASPGPNRRGASPKRTWRQTQADVAPNPNPCQLFPIAAHCRFEPFQALSRTRKRHPAFALAGPCSKHVTLMFYLPLPHR